MNSRKIALMGLILALLGSFFVFDVGQYLNLDALKAQQAALNAQVTDQPWLAAGVFFLAYVAVTALSLPGAALMTLLAGALFGLLEGFVLVSFASTAGATLAMLSSRFLLRDWVQARFGQRLAKIDAGIEREGPFYLFALRLVPAFPFFLINLAMGLTRLPVRTYWWVSQLGMLPGTLVFVNAGRELGQLESLSGILWPTRRLRAARRVPADRAQAARPDSGTPGLRRLAQTKKLRPQPAGHWCRRWRLGQRVHRCRCEGQG
jgi:uncharacterized membrane protein YdjX (TVP38/TMEM64 family)